jgi:hypothetical protein
MQAVSMAFLHPIVQRDSSYVLKGLQPSEDRVTLDVKRTELAQIETVLQGDGPHRRLGATAQRGRQGSAIADELIDFGASRSKWHPT